jgi:geranylgeranyl diphosphate synthase type II
MQKYKEIFDSLNQQINEYIIKSIPQKEPKQLYEPYKYIISSGGKRIRPVLTMLCCGACNSNPQEALDAAIAIEILHNFTLVHDDIMDNSPIRRGNQTIHNKWDEATAILTGDIMLGYAYKSLHNYHYHKRNNDIHNIFTNALIEVCEGQALDMNYNSRKEMTIYDYLVMIKKKTAVILEACGTIGAIIANADDLKINALKEYTSNLGIGFQIQDDILDLYAQRSELGKKIGQDIIEGKKTYLIIKAKLLAKDKDDIDLIELFFNNNGLGEEYIPKMQEIIQKSGALEESKQEALNYFNKASKSLNVLENNLYTETLEWLINWLSYRNY